MATGNLTDNGNLLLQQKFREIADQLTLYGLSKGDSNTLVNLIVGNETPVFLGVNINGLITSGTYSFRIGVPTNLQPGRSWHSSIVQGIVFKNENGQELLRQSLGTSDSTGTTFSTTGDQAIFTLANDGTTGKYTLSTITVSFT